MQRVKVLKAPGYEDRWHASLITYLRSSDGRDVAVLEADDKSWHVIEKAHVRETPYDQCGCIFPCPDHTSPSQDGARDRAYWNERDSKAVATDDQTED